MKNLLILMLAVLIFATPGFASEYFVATSGHDTCNGLGSSTGTINPCAWGTLTKVNNSSLSTGDVINLRRGDTFTDNFINKAATGITFQAYTDSLSPSTVPPIIDFAGTYAVLAKDGQKFNGLWFKKGQFYSWNSGTSTVIVTDCIFSDSTVNSNGVVDWEAGDLYIFNSLFIDMKMPAVFTSRKVYLYNSMFFGAGIGASLQSSGLGNITYGHNLIWGHDWNMGVRSAECVGNCVDDGTNSNSWVDSFGISTTALDPKFVSYTYPKPKMAWGHDDSGNVQHLFDVLDANHGLTKASFNMYVNNYMGYFAASGAGASDGGAVRLQRLKDFVDSGRVEIVAHSWFHNDMTMDNAFVIDVDTFRNPNPRIVIDGSGTSKHITLSSDNSANNITIDWSYSGAAGNTWRDKKRGFSELRAAMKCTVAAWVPCPATGTSTGWGVTGSNLKEGLWLSSMKDEPGSTTFPYQVKADRGPLSWRFLDDEIIHAKEELEIIFDVASGNHPHAAIHSFSYPNSVSDATVFKYFSNVIPGVFKGARISDTGSQTLSSLYVYNMLGIPAYAFRGWVNSGTSALEPAVRAAARNLYGWSQMKGGVLIPYTHGTGDLTVQQTQWIIDELTGLSVEFVTTSEIMDWIKSTTTNFTNDGCTGVGTPYACCTGTDSYCTNSQYTHTFPHGDYHITTSSPAVWKGTSNALVTTDILGNMFHTPPSIGPFELAINGVCDPTYDGTIQYSMTTGYCSAGTVFAATNGICPCTWQCAGSGGGTTASCSTAQDKTGPSLILSTLKDGSITTSSTLIISGTLSDPSGITGLMINNVAVTVTGSSFSFSYSVTLQTGANIITIIATDKLGNRTTVTRTITRISALSSPSIKDALKAIRSVVGPFPLTSMEQVYYDVAPLASSGKPLGNGIVNLADANAILQRSLGLIVW